MAIGEVRMVPQHWGNVGEREGYPTLAQIRQHGVPLSDPVCLTPHTPQCLPLALVRLRWARRRWQRTGLEAAIKAALPPAVPTEPDPLVDVYCQTGVAALSPRGRALRACGT